MKRMAVLIAVMLALASPVRTPLAAVADDVVFGPKTLKIPWWHVHVSSHGFRCNEPGEGVLTIRKRSSNRTLQNGYLLVGRDWIGLRSLFRGAETEMVRTIRLKRRNRLYVLFVGRPGARLEVSVRKKSSSPPPSVSFDVSPDTIVQGEEAVLNWQVENADTVTIDNGVGAVAAQGSTTVSPQDDTVYTLTATGPGGSVSQSVFLAVTLPPPVISLAADPSTIRVGESASLNWETQYAETCEILPEVGTVAAEGSVQVTPSQTTTYRLEAANTDASSTAEAVVTVLHPPSVEINASPLFIFRGETATLSWTVTQADTVSIAPEIGEVAVSGEVDVSPQEKADYIFTATGPWGSVQETVRVSVIEPPADVLLGRLPDEQAGAGGMAGQSVRLLNGNALHSRMDAQFASPHGLGLTFAAHYNSRAAFAGELGFGWSHTYSAQMDSAHVIAGRTVVRIIDETGRAVYFLADGDGGFLPLFEEKSRLACEGDGYAWHRRNGLRYGFSSSGMLAWIDDAVGNRLTVSRDAQGRPAAVADAATGRALGFSYNAAGQLEAVTGPVTDEVPTGVYATCGYDAAGNPGSVTYADGSGVNYAYDDPADGHNLTGAADKMGRQMAAWVYDAEDRCVSYSSPDGRGVTVDYSQEDRVDVTDAYGALRTHTVEAILGHRRVTALAGPAAAPYAPDSPVRWGFDSALNLTEVETAAGTVHRFQGHDERGNPATVTLAAGSAEQRVIAFAWHPEMAVPLSRTEASLLGTGSKTTIWDYDDDGDEISNEAPAARPRRLVESGYTLDPAGAVEAYSYVTAMVYNAAGQPLAIDGPLAGSDDTTTFAYDGTTGDLLSVTRSLVGATTFGDYDAAGRPGVVTDVNGRTETLVYDALGRVLTVQHAADGSAAERSYNLAGQVTATLDEDGILRTHDYESIYGRLFQITDHQGNFIEHDYDAQGNLIRRAWFGPDGARSSIRRWSYAHPDLPGKLYRQIQPDDTYTEFGYDAAGRLASVTDPEGNTTAYAYDALDRVVEIIQPGAVTTALGYDAQGNRDSVIDPGGNETRYTFDDMGRVVLRVSPDSGTTAYTYDALGNPAQKMDANGTLTTYTHDVLGRLTAVSFADPAQNISFAYDAGIDGIGRRTGMTDPSGATAYAYDARGRLVEKNYTIDGVAYTVGRSFTPAGRVWSVTYPSGRSVDYDRSDCRCTVTGVSTTFESITKTLVAGLSYRPFGGADGMSQGSGTVENQHDEAGRLVVANPGAPMERTYTYDNVGNLLTVDAPGDPGYNRTYTYDDLYRLTSAVLPWETVSFTYDDNGNRLTRTIGAATETYGYMAGTNRLDSVTGAETVFYVHDAAGRITSIDDRTLTYNDNDRLVRVEENGAVLGEYVYNGLGQRVKKTVDGETTIFHWDLDDNIIAEGGSDGTFAREYIYRNSGRLAMVDVATGTIYHFFNDFLGTPLMMADETGLVIWQGRYRPFGDATINPNSTVENNFRFPGQYFDAETGWHYNYHRYYDSNTGRYLTLDPIGIKNLLNLYCYSENNPILNIDRRGLRTTFYMMTVGGAFGFSGQIGTATALTDCANGKRFEAEYFVFAVGGTVGIELPSPFEILNIIFANHKSLLDGPKFTIDANYPPSYTSYLDIEGHRVSFFYSFALGDIEVGPYEGGRTRVKAFSYGYTGGFEAQIFKTEGVHLMRIGEPKEKACDCSQ